MANQILPDPEEGARFLFDCCDMSGLYCRDDRSVAVEKGAREAAFDASHATSTDHQCFFMSLSFLIVDHSARPSEDSEIQHRA